MTRALPYAKKIWKPTVIVPKNRIIVSVSKTLAPQRNLTQVVGDEYYEQFNSNFFGRLKEMTAQSKRVLLAVVRSVPWTPFTRASLRGWWTRTGWYIGALTTGVWYITSTVFSRPNGSEGSLCTGGSRMKHKMNAVTFRCQKRSAFWSLVVWSKLTDLCQRARLSRWARKVRF